MRTRLTKEYRIERARKDLAKKLSLEARLEEDVKHFIRRINKDFIARKENFNINDYRQGLAGLLAKHYKQAKQKYYNDMRIETRGIEFKSWQTKSINDRIDIEVDSWIAEKALRQADIILKTTKTDAEKIRARLVELALALWALSDEGFTDDEVDTETLEQLDTILNRRARTIATTEIQEAAEITKLSEARSIADVRAAERAGELTEGQADSSIRTIEHEAEQNEEFTESFLALAGAGAGNVRKEWNAILDSRTRETHAELDGEVVGIDEYFNVGGYKMLYAGDKDNGAPPEEFMNCRCFIMYYEDEE